MFSSQVLMGYQDTNIGYKKHTQLEKLTLQSSKYVPEPEHKVRLRKSQVKSSKMK